MKLLNKKQQWEMTIQQERQQQQKRCHFATYWTLVYKENNLNMQERKDSISRREESDINAPLLPVLNVIIDSLQTCMRLESSKQWVELKEYCHLNLGIGDC